MLTLRWHTLGRSLLAVGAILMMPGAALSQDERAEDAVVRGLTALNAGRMDEYLSQFMPGARVLIQYHEDGGDNGDNGVGVELLPSDAEGSLAKLAWIQGDVISQVFGGNAVT